MKILPTLERKNSRLLVWPLFIRGTTEHVGFRLRFRMACVEKSVSTFQP